MGYNDNMGQGKEKTCRHRKEKGRRDIWNQKQRMGQGKETYIDGLENRKAIWYFP